MCVLKKKRHTNCVSAMSMLFSNSYKIKEQLIIIISFKGFCFLITNLKIHYSIFN